MNISAIVSELKAERVRIEKAIAALEGLPHNGAGRAIQRRAASAATRRRGHLSAEGRRRLSELMKKRWAERRKKASAKK